VLFLGFLLTTSFSRTWRTAGTTCLVLVFGLWPWWSSGTSWGADHWTQVDVLLEVAGGPPMIWSAAALQPTGNRTLELRPGPGAWSLSVPDPSGDCRLSVESTRASRTSVTWLADVGVEDLIHLEIPRRQEHRTGLIRNEFARRWTGVWLLHSELGPRQLGDLPPLGAVLVEGRDVALAKDRLNANLLRAGLPLQRAWLVEAAFGCAIAPMLEQGRPVLVAWSEGPVRPARTGRGKTVTAGATLLIVAGRTEA